MINKIKLICIGKVKERYLQEGIDEFLKRVKPFCAVEVVELKDEGVAKEADKLQKYLTTSAFVLDATGKEHTSEEFAEMFRKLDGTATFVIGGPEGIAKEIKQNAKLISLSRMTFTHEMCRLFLAEQIYRAYMILNGRSYHK